MWNKVDWIGRFQTLWVFVPTWLKVLILLSISAVLGFIQSLPLQALFVLSLMTLGFGLWLILIVNEALSVAMAGPNRRKRILKTLGERACRDEKGSRGVKDLSNAFHNKALRFVDSELGRDYWAQFKVASKPPSVIAPDYPPEECSLLYMIHGRKEWLSRTINELRAKE